MKVATVKKQPNEKRRWNIDYADALDTADIIITATSAFTPAGITVVTTHTDDRVGLAISGGTDGVTYKVTMTVTTTNSNEIIEDEFYVKVKEI